MCKCNLHLDFSQCNIIHIHVHTSCTSLFLCTAFSALNLFASTQTISAKMSFICCRLLPMWRIAPMTSTLCPKNQMLRILMVFNFLILLKHTQSGLKKNTLLPEQQTLQRVKTFDESALCRDLLFIGCTSFFLYQDKGLRSKKISLCDRFCFIKMYFYVNWHFNSCVMTAF